MKWSSRPARVICLPLKSGDRALGAVALALQSVDAWRNHFDVFDQPGLPPAGVDSRGKGGGMAIGRRFGDRFLAQVQFAIARHDIDDMDEQLIDIEVLLTGTVLFRPLRTFQPFLRGGLGGGGQALDGVAQGGGGQRRQLRRGVG